MTKGQTSKLEAKKKKKGAASTQRRQRALPAGWIQGDFLPSTVTENDVLDLVEHGMVVNKSWRLPECETEPTPKEGERVLCLATWPEVSPCLPTLSSEDIACPNASSGLPPFSLDRPGPPKKLALSNGERTQIQPLVDALIAVVWRGVTGMDLLETFQGRRIQPLQARDHVMWHCTGPSDTTRSHPEDVSEETVSAWVRSITGTCDNPMGARRVKAFRAENPPPNEEWTNWHSAVSNGNPAEEEEGSMEGSADSVEYVSDSRETKGETKEEEEESEEQSSSPSPPEHRTKHRHDLAVPPAPPVAPSARSVKRTRGPSAEPVNQPSKVAKPSGSKPRKALPRMRIVVPVASAVVTSATSLPRQDDDPMDTDNAATSQQVGLPSEVIHLDNDDQRRSEPVLAPVPGVIQPAAIPAMNVPPTETVDLMVEPTGAQLGMPREPSAMPGPSAVQYDARRLPEDQVGAAKDAMVQVELMKTCEMGSAYNALKAEKTQLAADLEVAANDLSGMKKTLAEREKSLEESRETNKALVAEVEKMKKERSEWMGQLKLMNTRCRAQENYVGNWAKKMVALLGDFCRDVEAETVEIERSLGQPNVPLGDEANRDMFRVNSRLNKVGPFIGRLRGVVGRIDKEV
ncbi:hypothetical protein ZWY2020_043582 [Hordeum vulgare]|nr:hypothetical protein ZWY2020_043582 [Hordeum vulgare]